MNEFDPEVGRFVVALTVTVAFFGTAIYAAIDLFLRYG